ncbi:MAG TPA: hypothetical protein VN539_02580 [Candidatus Saccharimonadales bacterium]|nr:hypothetical protein [Candidatus Saccharimonadales bacterium]
MSFFASLRRLDRRWIFLAIGLLVVVPLLTGFHIAPVLPSARARGFYDAIEKLPAGSTVVLAGDYDPGTIAENYPMHLAATRHLMARKIKIIAVELYPGGPPLADRVLHLAGAEFDRKEGVDYVNLGYKSGNEAVMSQMGSSIPVTFPTDRSGTPVSRIPVMKGVENFSQIKLLVSISAGYPGTKEWVQQVVSRYHVPMVAGVTAVSAPEYYPYLQAGQLQGLLGGMAGAAEYETLVKAPGLATRGMDAQSLAHVFIALMILLGNLATLPQRSSGGKA